eukprot:6075595-Ditylum_brightwellii.AAC.1
MPSSSANNGKQSAVNTSPQVSQKTQNLEKIPIIPPKDTPKKTKDTSTVINKYKVLPCDHSGRMGQLKNQTCTEHYCWI